MFKYNDVGYPLKDKNKELLATRLAGSGLLRIDTGYSSNFALFNDNTRDINISLAFKQISTQKERIKSSKLIHGNIITLILKLQKTMC
ncbi:MAG TPA: hypothetical protein QKA14_01575 [Candidatus Megaira endosymbiont of Hartmannula sinica]|nr:hypothetical protein [Candidatus Megaera endosymbiont of Hartmannula sinica]